MPTPTPQEWEEELSGLLWGDFSHQDGSFDQRRCDNDRDKRKKCNCGIEEKRKEIVDLIRKERLLAAEEEREKIVLKGERRRIIEQIREEERQKVAKEIGEKVRKMKTNNHACCYEDSKYCLDCQVEMLQKFINSYTNTKRKDERRNHKNHSETYRFSKQLCGRKRE